MSTYSIIRSPEALQAGDHISLPIASTFGVFTHHALVVDTKDGITLIEVVSNVTSGGLGSSLAVFPFGRSCHVREHIVDLGEYMRQGVLRRYNYGECNAPFEAIQKARSLLGEFDYDQFDNNCEHFVRWCKSGRGQSDQAQNAKGLLQVTGSILLGVLGLFSPGSVGPSQSGNGVGYTYRHNF